MARVHFWRHVLQLSAIFLFRCAFPIVFGSPWKCQDSVSSCELHPELEELGGVHCEPRTRSLHFSSAALAAPSPYLSPHRPPGGEGGGKVNTITRSLTMWVHFHSRSRWERPDPLEQSRFPCPAGTRLRITAPGLFLMSECQKIRTHFLKSKILALHNSLLGLAFWTTLKKCRASFCVPQNLLETKAIQDTALLRFQGWIFLPLAGPRAAETPGNTSGEGCGSNELMPKPSALLTRILSQMCSRRTSQGELLSQSNLLLLFARQTKRAVIIRVSPTHHS